jgi:O-antigen/teichoic acid export membrane protein
MPVLRREDRSDVWSCLPPMVEEVTAEARSRTGRIVRGLQWTYISVALQGALKCAVLVVLARVLTPRDFGLLGFALMCTSFVDRIAQLGIAPALVQAQVVTQDTIKTGQTLGLLCGVLSALVVSVTASSAASFFRQPELGEILLVLSLGCIPEALASTKEALLQRSMRFKEMMVSDNSAYAFGMAGVGVLLAILGWGVWSLVYATLAMKVIRWGLLAYFQPSTSSGHVRLHDVFKLLRTGLGFSLARLLNFFSLQGDNFIVGRLLGVEALGMYSRAYQLMTLPAMYVGQVFEKVMFPSMAQSQTCHKRLEREFLMTLEAITLIALPAGAVMFTFAREIVLVAFGERWSAIIPVVSIVSFGVFFRTAYKCSDTVVRSVGAVYHYAARQALYTLLVTSGAALGAVLGGLSGVAVGVVAAVTLNYISMTMLCSRTVGIRYQSIAYAHLSGAWATSCVAGVLAMLAPVLRRVSDHPSTVCATGMLLAGVTWLIAVCLAHKMFPGGFIERVFDYVGRYRCTARGGQVCSESSTSIPGVQ